MRRHALSLLLYTTSSALRDGWVVGDVVLGPRRAARTRALRDASLQRTRERLEARWKALDDEVDHLREHRRTIFNDELKFKRLKREKLQVKDMLAALARRAPPPSIVLGAGACGTVYSALHEKTKEPAACKGRVRVPEVGAKKVRIDGRGGPRAAGQHPITRGWWRGVRAAHGAPRPVDRRPLLGDDVRRRLFRGDGPTYSAEHGRIVKGPRSI